MKLLQILSKHRQQIGLVIFSGILSIVIFPSIDLEWLAWIAFIPLFAAIQDATHKQAFWLGWAVGVIHFAGTLYWVTVAMVIYGRLPIVVGGALLLLMATFLALGAAAASGGVPQPSIVVYGLVRDPYGYPYIDQARVVFSRATTECAVAPILGIIGGINYRAALDVDSGGARYDGHAVQKSDVVEGSVEVGGQAQPLISSNRLVVGHCGVPVRMDLLVGVDSDGDGLSDAWELELVAQSRGLLSGITDVNPDDDFDGDGLSNRQEFLAGTFAFLDTDLLYVERLEATAGGRLKLRFLTSGNVTYRVIVAAGLQGEPWMPVPFAVTPEGPLGYNDLVGDGAYQDVYVDGNQSALFLRLATR